MIGRNAVLCDESLQYVETFGRDLKDASIFEGERRWIGGIFYETSVHEVLADSLCDFARHAESRCCRGRDDPLRIIRVGLAIRLAEAQRRQVGRRFIRRERIGICLEESGMICQLERDHERCKEVMSILLADDQ